MNPRSLFFLVAALFGLNFSTAAAPKQPRMHAAIEALHAARTAPDPLPHLKTALERIKAAIPNKAGYRGEAADLVKKAISEVEAHHRPDANKLIDQAITKLEKGIAAGN